MTFDELRERVREMKAADEASVKLVVFHSPGDLSRVLKQLPSTTRPSDVPRTVVFPQLVPEGSVLCVGDPTLAEAILAAASSILPKQEEPL